MKRTLHRLKRHAKRIARDEGIPLHAALDRVAVSHGFARWSLLARESSEVPLHERLLAAAKPGTLTLIGARPRQGKTLLALQTATAAMRQGLPCGFFSLDYTERDLLDSLRALDEEPARYHRLLRFDPSDRIDADYIASAVEKLPKGSLVIVDFLQLLDQRRDASPLDRQVRSLKALARTRGLRLATLSQIDRRFDPSLSPVPGPADLRLPNPVELGNFDTMCFLHGGQARILHP